ncbi:PWWP domain-containing protein 3 [Amaranthus tricolor]|uniref:PWWP domain-containing protein 3 n=1 Tax=Amaranthus tricolor TaxID=29722 RepID=UPI002582D3D2|nr:PWWP domain-containing protein 3 [Amaranthus tricolor]
MDNKDDKMVVEKPLVEVEKATVSSILKEESCKLDLTNSTCMSTQISKNQGNNCGVLKEQTVKVVNSVDGGVGGEDVGVSKELSTGTNEENIVDDGGEMSKENKYVKFGGNGDGILDGNTGSGAKFGSIAQRTRNRAKKEDMEGVDVEVKRKGRDDVDEDDEENTFSVGDFVWGKIKSHPWWPGRIYDPSDASEFALKYKHEGQLLVAYFGDRTFAWCDPSQLKSFEENFEEMSKQSSLKTFVSAVMEALNQFGTLFKLQMTCSCARAKEVEGSLPFVVNGGVKQGVYVPEKRISMCLADQCTSSALLADIKRLATCGFVTNALELTVLKSWLSAFFHAKFGYSLPICCEPMSIEDPVDRECVPSEIFFGGPDDGGYSIGTVDQNLGKKGSSLLLTPLDISQKGRKSKTITELLGVVDTGNELERNINGSDGETPVSKSVVKSRKKRRRVPDEDQSSVRGVVGNDRDPKEVEQSGKLMGMSGRRIRKTNDENDSQVITRSSARKTKDGSEMEKQQKKDMMAKVNKKSISLSINSGPMVEEVYGRVSPRERKLSKYLSPPYTMQLQRQRSSCSENGSDQAGLAYSDVTKTGEKMDKESDKFMGSPRLAKCSSQKFQRLSKDSSCKRVKIDHAEHKGNQSTPSSEIAGPVKSIGSLNCVLSEIHSAARDPLSLKNDKSFDSIKGFLYSYRNSNYKDGPNHSSYKRKRVRNSSGTKHGSNEKVRNDGDQRKPKSKPVKKSALKGEEPKLEPKAEHEAPCGLSSSSTALIITFPAGFSMPTKEAIIQMCSKFGEVNKSETEMIAKSSTAKIVFALRSSAKAAMKTMRKSALFGNVKVSYKVLNPTASKGKKIDVQNKKKMKASKATSEAKSPAKPPAVNPPSEQPPEVVSIRQKLESLSSMLAKTANKDGKMSQEAKCNLENEVKELLKKVKMMKPSSS